MNERAPDLGPQSYVTNLDHEVASQNVYDSAFKNGDPMVHLDGSIKKQLALDEQTYHDVLGVGMYFIPLDEKDNLTSDDRKYQVYTVAATMALAALDALCERLDIEPEVFRKAWRTNGFVRMIDIEDPRYTHMTLRDKHQMVADGMLAVGHQALDALEDCYEPVIEQLDRLNQYVVQQPYVSKGAFGYVLGGGLSAINRILDAKEGLRSVGILHSGSTLSDWGVADKRSFDRTVRSAGDIDHDSHADQIDTQAFYVSESSETYLEGLLSKHADRDGRLFDSMQSIALRRYPNELGSEALDDEGFAFLQGMVVGLDTAHAHAKAVGVDHTLMDKEWKRQRVHSYLAKLVVLSDAQAAQVDAHIHASSSPNEATFRYVPVLEKLAHAEGYDEEETVAFVSGFAFMLSTSSKSTQRCVTSAISKEVERQMETFDDELTRFLQGPLE